ncbi:hypothetical protein CEXT_419741 [Caerostris extrusa]|uniref:Uncharacterized protein n=1 Tax=Caerostris extrusa TaxID=172846 RepID=A0AAV4TAP1_CAEEX|nr:hypothetical protein CEXT_419741 [Caerostris extrusa]
MSPERTLPKRFLSSPKHMRIRRLGASDSIKGVLNFENETADLFFYVFAFTTRAISGVSKGVQAVVPPGNERWVRDSICGTERDGRLVRVTRRFIFARMARKGLRQ